MRTRTLIAGAAVFAAVLLTAGIAGAFSAGDTHTAPNESIEVSTSSEVEAQPDRGIVSVAVVATGDDVETVREQVASDASSMRDALNETGIDDDQIRTTRYDISTNHRYHGPREGEEPPEYRAIHQFEITVNDTDRVGEVIDVSVTNGADEINGVQFALSTERHQELREQALQGAMDSARGEAGAIAESADLTITGVHSVSTNDQYRTPYRVEAAESGDAAAAPPTDIDSGPVTVRASVDVVYEAQQDEDGS